MRRIVGSGVCAMLVVVCSSIAEPAESWKAYRNETFGFELSYPPELEYRAYVDGSSADLIDTRTGRVLVHFAVSPPFECPRQPATVSAKSEGIETAKMMTQADGPEGSSSCGDPVTVRESVSPHGVKIYELELTCVRASDGAHDDTEEADQSPTPAEPEVTAEGTKGPTYFADISPSWKQRVLLADPTGVDPRMQSSRAPAIDLSLLRAILNTLTTFPTAKPAGVCIEELRPRGFSISVPSK